VLVFDAVTQTVDRRECRIEDQCDVSGFRFKNFNNGMCKSCESVEISLFETAEILWRIVVKLE